MPESHSRPTTVSHEQDAAALRDYLRSCDGTSLRIDYNSAASAPTVQNTVLAALLKHLHHFAPFEPAALLHYGGQRSDYKSITGDTERYYSRKKDFAVQDSTDLGSATLGFPLGPLSQPLLHVERIWKASRGCFLAIEPRPEFTEKYQESAAGSSLQRVLEEGRYALRENGLLLFAVDYHAADGINPSLLPAAGVAIAEGFEVHCIKAVASKDSSITPIITEQLTTAVFELNYLDILSANSSSTDTALDRTTLDVLLPERQRETNAHEFLFLLAFRRPRGLGRIIGKGRAHRHTLHGENTASSLTTFKKKRAFVYNCYLDTGGGGERSSMDFAAALDDLGYEVSLVSSRAVDVSLTALKASFGIAEHYQWPLRIFSNESELALAVVREGVEVFVNHTFSSYMPNPAPIGFYVAMFPIPTLPGNIVSLLSYQSICCISEFTEEYVKRFWYEGLKTEVIYPPISAVHQEGDTGSFFEKERLVLQIGRFNVEGHSKCQREAIETFCMLRQRNILGSNWRMRVVGRVNKGLRNEEYIERCREQIQDADVELITNASFASIRDLYRRAACLWQFTGYGSDFGVAPQFCEHLGLVAMDCFSYGTIPMIYQRGGMVPLIRHAENGFCFSSQEELIELMQHVALHFKGSVHQSLYQQAKTSTKRLSFIEYRDAIENMLHRMSQRPTTVHKKAHSAYPTYISQSRAERGGDKKEVSDVGQSAQSA